MFHNKSLNFHCIIIIQKPQTIAACIFLVWRLRAFTNLRSCPVLLLLHSLLFRQPPPPTALPCEIMQRRVSSSCRSARSLCWVPTDIASLGGQQHPVTPTMWSPYWVYCVCLFVCFGGLWEKRAEEEKHSHTEGPNRQPVLEVATQPSSSSSSSDPLILCILFAHAN